MTTATGSVQNAVEKREAAAPARVSRKEALSGLLSRNSDAVRASLPTGYNAERFLRLLLTTTNTTPKLLECDPRSFLAAGVMCAQLGLEPNDPRQLASLVPFKGKVQLIIGYRGMIDLARRSGLVSSIFAFPVYKGDHFHYELGMEPRLEHKPAEDGNDDPANLTHVYAVAKVNGEPQFVVLTRKQVDRAKASSQFGGDAKSPWSTHYEEMAKKTAIRRLCKLLPQSVEMARADANDETAITLADLALGGDESGAAPYEATYDHDDVIDATVVDPDVTVEPDATAP